MTRRIQLFSFLASISALSMYCCNDNVRPSEKIIVNPAVATPVINYSVAGSFPHDTTLFTEGFLMHNGKLFESTGSPEELPQSISLIGIINLSTGEIDKKIVLDKTKYFGEGIVFLNDKLYQLTYKNQLGFIYNAASFRQIGTFSYLNAEGWSLTTDGMDLIMADGTDKLTFINPVTLKPAKIVKVTENGQPLEKLNELEYIKSFIYANVWQTNYIVKINPSDGKVVGKLDLSSLASDAKYKNPGSDVMNGIAYDSANNKVYITGKLWPTIYEISFPY